MKKKISLIWILAAALAVSGGVYTAVTEHSKAVEAENKAVLAREGSLSQLKRGLNIEFRTDVELDNGAVVLEYGAEPVEAAEYVVSANGEVEAEPSVVEAKEVGTTIVTYTVKSEADEYGQTAEMGFVRKFIVRDTQAPEIVLSQDSYNLTIGDSFDTDKAVKSVSDPVDGAVPKTDALKEDEAGYTIKSDVNTGKAGEYKVVVTAQDQHGNKTEKEVKVSVKSRVDAGSGGYSGGYSGYSGGSSSSHSGGGSGSTYTGSSGNSCSLFDLAMNDPASTVAMMGFRWGGSGYATYEDAWNAWDQFQRAHRDTVSQHWYIDYDSCGSDQYYWSWCTPADLEYTEAGFAYYSYADGTVTYYAWDNSIISVFYVGQVEWWQ